MITKIYYFLVQLLLVSNFIYECLFVYSDEFWFHPLNI